MIAIDPGIQGGIAWEVMGKFYCITMPKTMTEQIDKIKEIWGANRHTYILVEKVGTYRPGNSGPTAVKFARHCGNLEGALYGLKIPTLQVTPSKWMSKIGTWSKDKPERKRQIKDEMQRRYPYLKVTLRTSDALGMLTYAVGGSK